MGYRSDFVLLVHGKEGEMETLAKVIVWLYQKADAANDLSFFHKNYSWYNYLIDNLEENRGSSAPNTDYLLFMDDNIKMYDFDDIKFEFVSYIENELKLEVEYVRLGEELDDIDQYVSGDCDRRTSVMRSISLDSLERERE